MLFAPYKQFVRRGLHCLLCCLSRANYDDQGVHAMCYSCWGGVAGRTWSDVLCNQRAFVFRNGHFHPLNLDHLDFRTNKGQLRAWRTRWKSQNRHFVTEKPKVNVWLGWAQSDQRKLQSQDLLVLWKGASVFDLPSVGSNTVFSINT